jgi:hypothetical protein
MQAEFRPTALGTLLRQIWNEGCHPILFQGI